MGGERTGKLVQAVVVVAGLAGCGSGTDGGASSGDVCPALEPCGGDLVGEWELVGTCATFDLAELARRVTQADECSDLYRDVNLEYTGTLAFDGNGAYTRSLVMVESTRLVLTSECNAAITGESAPLTDSACQTFADQGAASQPDATVSCSFVEGSCHCNAVASFADAAEGSYTLSGNAVSFDGGSPREYCVQGLTLRLVGGVQETRIELEAHKL